MTMEVIENGESGLEVRDKINGNFAALAAAGGSSEVGFQQAGTGASTRTAQAKLRETISAADYDTLANAIAAAKVSGAPTTILISGSINLSATLVVDAPNILLQGTGSDSAHDVGTQGAGARASFVWTGAGGGTMVRFASPVGAGNQCCTGGGMRDIYLNAANSAAIGLQIQSWRKGTFENLHFNNPTTVAVDVGVVATLGEARDVQNCVFRNISSRHLETTGGTGGLLRLDGDATANTSLNMFEQLDCQFLNGTAYLFNNSDNNYLMRCRAFRAGGGTGAAVVFNGNNSAADRVARSNIFVHLTTNGALPVIMRGTSSFTHPAIDNSMMFLDFDNGYAPPTFETGATGQWSDTRGYTGGSLAGTSTVRMALGGTVSELDTARTRLSGTSSSAHIVNGSDDHLRLSNAAGNAWGLNMDASGNLRAVRLSGTGSFSIGANVLFNGQAVSVGAPDSAGTSFRVLRVPN